jgi:phage tail tape-measure protein
MHRMNTTTSLSLAEAAAATGMVKSSILRAIKSGRLSGARDDLGQWRIEASELFRVYRPVAEHQSAADAPQQYAPPDAALIAELSARAVLAEQRLGDIRELLTQARQDIERWRDQADAWREQASTSQRQLTDQREREPVSLWRWLRPTG